MRIFASRQVARDAPESSVGAVPGVTVPHVACGGQEAAAAECVRGRAELWC
jgi:hypothetical protein